jgi:hypothetical protein
MDQRETTFEGAGQSRPRHSRIFARAEHDHYVEPFWCSQRLFAVESFGPPGRACSIPAAAGGASCAPSRMPATPLLAATSSTGCSDRSFSLQGVTFSKQIEWNMTHRRQP